MKEERISLRLDEETNEKLQFILKKYPDSKISDIVRNSLKEYLKIKISKEEIMFNLVPKIFEPLKSYKISKIYNLEKPVFEILDGFPIGIILSNDKDTIEFLLRLEETDNDILCLLEFEKTSITKEKHEQDLLFYYFRDFENERFQSSLRNYFNKLSERNMI